MTTKDEIDKVIEFIKLNAKEIIEERGEEHFPIMFMFTPTELKIIGIELTDETKELYKPGITALLRHSDADAYITINEAWQHSTNGDTETSKRIMSGQTRVSELPLDDRQEILIIMAVKNNEFAEMHSSIIVHTDDDRRLLCEWEKMDGVGDGRMIIKEW